MKVDDFFEALGDIDEEKITEANRAIKKPVIPIFIKWASLAACIAVITVVGINMPQRPLETAPKENTQTSEDNAKIKTKDKITEDKEKNDIKENETQVSSEEEIKEAPREKKKETVHRGKKQEAPVTEPEKGALEEGSDNDALAEPVLTADAEDIQKAEAEKEASEEAGAQQGASGGGSSSMTATPAQYKKQKDDLEGLAERIYGGSYNDENGNTVIILTEDTPENREAVCSAKSLDASSAIFKQGAFSLEYLENLKNDILIFAQSDDEAFVISASVVVSENCVEVMVNTSDEEKLSIVKSFDGVGGAIKFKTVIYDGIVEE